MSTPNTNAWPALWALVIGFFMILVDTTIVSVANPAIMVALETDINMVVWATSAYLLAYAVPLLVCGRLGDKFGPKRIYMIGLVIFTLASLSCGFASSIEMLIIGRAAQGLGAAMMSPQSMAVITRLFPRTARGTAMGVWGAVAGVATLVGPVLGGVLVTSVGWEWIFFVNIPVGVIAFLAAWKYVPNLEQSTRRLDWVGVGLSGIGLFCLVFGIQEGQSYGWGTVTGSLRVWHLIVLGVLFLIAFVLWQSNRKISPLVPLSLFRDRNFSLANLTIALIGFSVTAMSLPLMFFTQLVLGLNAAQAALLLAPSAIISGVAAPFVGRLVDRTNPKYVALAGLSAMLVALLWYSQLMSGPNMHPLVYLLPSVAAGVANSAMWAPVSTSATMNLPLSQAGAGSGVYNTTRQIGSVLGAAALASLMQIRLTHYLGPETAMGTLQTSHGHLPEHFHDGFASAMAQSILLPASAIFLGAVVVLFYARPTR